ncbi:MAG TPA: hypothetical protein VF752_02715 [Thermoleophilaceae bacterium]
MSSSRRLTFAGLLVAVIAAFACQAGAAGGQSGGSPAVATAGQARVLLLYNCQRGRYKPRKVIVTCADANFRVRGIVWSRWTQTEARGRGTALVNDCNPNCAGGTFRTYPVRLHAFLPRMTGGCVPHSLFTRLAWRFPESKPEGPRKGTAKLVCPPSGP